MVERPAPEPPGVAAPVGGETGRVARPSSSLPGLDTLLLIVVIAVVALLAVSVVAAVLAVLRWVLVGVVVFGALALYLRLRHSD